MKTFIQQTNCDESELQGGLQSASGKHLKLRLESPRGNLAVFLLDEHMIEVLSYYPYGIYDQNNRKLFEGETDESGYFYHENIIADYYILKVNNMETLIPTLQEDDAPYQVRVIGEHLPEADEEIRDISEDEED